MTLHYITLHPNIFYHTTLYNNILYYRPKERTKLLEIQVNFYSTLMNTFLLSAFIQKNYKITAAL